MGEALGDSVTLHAFDLPDHGKSGDWDGQGVMHDAATEMALAVLAGMDADPVDVIGHSFGATVALRLAIEHPLHVRSVIMYEPVYFAPALADDAQFAALYARDTAEFDACLDAGDMIGATKAFHAIWSDGSAWDKVPAATRDYMVARIAFVRHSSPFLIADSAGLLTPGRFERADMPALLLRGAQSHWSEAINAACARRLPNVTDIALDGLGHMGPITDPHAVAHPVRAFLARS